MSSVLYDVPGPRARRRELIGSVLGTLVVLAVLGVAVWYAAGRGIFGSDRWDVLYDPPKDQLARDVWLSMLRGLGATLRAAAVAAPLALVLGIALAMWRTAKPAWLRLPAGVVVEVFRGLPVLLVMFFAQIGLGWEAFGAVVFGLVVYNMAIIAEIVRAGLAAIPKGQTEAAYAVGLTRGQTLRTILLPQAFRTMLPSIIAQLVVLLKDSSLGYIVGYAELLKGTQNNAQYFGNQYYVSLFTVSLAMFLTLNITLSWLARWVDRRTRRRPGAVDVPPPDVVTASVNAGHATP